MEATNVADNSKNDAIQRIFLMRTLYATRYFQLFINPTFVSFSMHNAHKHNAHVNSIVLALSLNKYKEGV